MFQWFKRLFRNPVKEFLLKEDLVPRIRFEDMRCPKCGETILWPQDRYCHCSKCSWAREWPVPAIVLYPDKPYRCPNCSGHIDLMTQEWKCIGLPDRKAVEELFGNQSKFFDMQSRKPCGWSGKDEDYGKTWR
jgi:ribosomal protein S27AE